MVLYYYRGKDVIRGSITIPFVFFLFMVIHGTTFAQNSKSSVININAALPIEGKISLDSLIRYVHLHTGMRFSFNSGKIKSSKIISFPKGKYSFNQLLAHIQKTTSLYYSIFKGYVILQDNPPIKTKGSSTKKNVISKKKLLASTAYHKIPTKKRKTSFASIIIVHTAVTKDEIDSKQLNSRMLRFQTNSIVQNTLIDAIVDNKKSIDTTSVNKISASKLPPKIVKSDSIKKISSVRADHSKSLSWHSQVGLFVSEIMYTNVSCEIGIKPAHFILSIGTNYQTFGWRIGVGSIFKSTDRSQWQISASICFLKRDFPSGDTIFKKLTTKGKLYNGAIQWCKNINPKWQIKIAPSFNILQTEYYYKNTLTPVARLPQSVNDFEQRVYLVRPPVLLKNSFDLNKSSNTKSWIGLSVGIYYKLF